jgi:hypothetical protein
VRQDVEYFNLQTLENNPGWRTKWFYARDRPSTGQRFGLDEFRPTNVLRPWASWAHELTEEEMKITQPLMEKIQQLWATPKKELSGLQLICTFIALDPATSRSSPLYVGLYRPSGPNAIIFR